MIEWEYKTIFMKFTSYIGSGKPDYDYPAPGTGWAGYKQELLTDERLTQYGSEGWELVNVVRLTTANVRADEFTWGIQYIFKRPKR
jgi:hypothetical protein